MPTHHRIGEIALGLFEALSDQPAGLPLGDLRPRVWERVPPSPEERKAGSNYLGGWTTGFVKAGFIRKANRRWHLTDEGRAAYRKYRDADPAALTREATQLYRIAMGEISSRSWERPPTSSIVRREQSPRPTASTPRPRPPGGRYAPHPDRDRRLASAVAVARFALDSPDLYEMHRNKLLSFAGWWATELDGKYKTRYRSFGARQPAATNLRHEHVTPRKALRDAMQREPERAAEILRDALACVVTNEEHERLTALGGQHQGWERYIAAGVDVFDEQEGKPLIESGRFMEKRARE